MPTLGGVGDPAGKIQVLLHFSSLLLGDSEGLLVCLRKGWALFWQANSVILFVTDNRKICYSHQEIAKILTFCHSERFSVIISFSINFYLFVPRGSFSDWDNVFKMAIKGLCSVFGCILGWNSCSKLMIPPTFLPLNTWAFFAL